MKLANFSKNIKVVANIQQFSTLRQHKRNIIQDFSSKISKLNSITFLSKEKSPSFQVLTTPAILVRLLFNFGSMLTL